MRIVISIVAAAILSILWGCASSDSRPYTAESVIQAQQAQHRTNNVPLSTTAAGIPITANQPSHGVTQSYPENSEHQISIVLKQGGQIKLEDGSLWEIAPWNQTETMVWFVAEKIFVTSYPSGRYPFKLTNRSRNIAVNARLIATGQAR